MKRRTFAQSFANAGRGLLTTFKEERNFKVHCLAAVIVSLAGYLCRLSAVEWAVLFLTFALVMVAEVVNTAIENSIDLVTQEKNRLAGKAKDAAAGAVLLAAIFSVAVGVAIFGPRLLDFLAP